MKTVNTNFINDLTLEEKVGQMLMFAFHGTEFNEQLKKQINDFHVGGVIHFARNIIDPVQATKLNFDIQNEAKIPLFIGLDQEGGIVQRITKDITPFPGAMALAATGENIHDLCKYVGTDLRNMNYNMVFAPVADVNNNPLNPVINSRSYSDNPNIVSKYVNEAVQGFQDALILPTIKHFPGHGDVSVDSHLSLPIVKKSKEEINKCELVPYIKASSDGVMISHILYEAIDEVYPSSLSKNVITGLLRNELGFKGLVVTDSLTMGAINNTYTKKDIVRLACNAGVDVLIFCGVATIEEQEEIYQAFISLVKENIISIERINESVARILSYKEKYNLNKKDWHKEYIAPNIIQIEEGKRLSQESITFARKVRNNSLIESGKNNLKNVLIIFPKIRLFTLVDNDNNQYQTLGNCLKNHGVTVDELIIDDNSIDYELIRKKEKDYDKVLMATYNVCKNDYQVKVFNSLSKDKVVVIAMRSPYDIMFLNDVKEYICIYEATDLALNSLCECLLGKKPFVGKLPIKL